MEEKTINVNVPYSQVRHFVKCLRVVSHQNEYTPYAVYEAVEALIKVHGLDKLEINHISSGEWE